MALDTDMPFPDIERRFADMHAASRTLPPWTKAERTILLRKLKGVIAGKRDAFAAAISADFGTRAHEETLLAD